MWIDHCCVTNSAHITLVSKICSNALSENNVNGAQAIAIVERYDRIDLINRPDLCAIRRKRGGHTSEGHALIKLIESVLTELTEH